MSTTNQKQALVQAMGAFEEFVTRRGLRHSRPRQDILETFLSVEQHVTAEELTSLARKKNPRVGVATVYRTMKLLCEGGLSRELRLEDGTARYEHLHGHQHHDHLICTGCGRLVEVVDPDIEQLQERLCLRHGFTPVRHRMEIYGTCETCTLGAAKQRARPASGPRASRKGKASS